MYIIISPPLRRGIFYIRGHYIEGKERDLLSFGHQFTILHQIVPPFKFELGAAAPLPSHCYGPSVHPSQFTTFFYDLV